MNAKRLTDGTFITWVLALCAAALELGTTNAACVVGALVKVPLPLSHRVELVDDHLHFAG